MQTVQLDLAYRQSSFLPIGHGVARPRHRLVKQEGLQQEFELRSDQGHTRS